MKDLNLVEMEDELDTLKTEIQQKKYDLIFDITGLQQSEIFIGDWDCDKSPIGKCVYDNIEDSAHDFCVFCHQPDERK